MGWATARQSAWKAFGRRYWRLIVAIELARKAAPALAVAAGAVAVAAGVGWAYTHLRNLDAPTVHAPSVDPPAWLPWAGAAVAVGAVVWLVRRRRNPYRIPAAYRRHSWTARIAALLAAVGVVVLALLWRPSS